VGDFWVRLIEFAFCLVVAAAGLAYWCGGRTAFPREFGAAAFLAGVCRMVGLVVEAVLALRGKRATAAPSEQGGTRPDAA
jgi:hypothetical protein